jgi:hypothetical protein
MILPQGETYEPDWWYDWIKKSLKKKCKRLHSKPVLEKVKALLKKE